MRRINGEDLLYLYFMSREMLFKEYKCKNNNLLNLIIESNTSSPFYIFFSIFLIRTRIFLDHIKLPIIHYTPLLNLKIEVCSSKQVKYKKIDRLK